MPNTIAFAAHGLPDEHVTNDIARLYSGFSQQKIRYFDAKQQERTQQAGQWPLLGTIIEQSNKPAQIPELRSPANYNNFAVLGVAGGVGTSTVTANLAASLAIREFPVFCCDFSPANSLRLHFGMDITDPTGLATQVLGDQPWYEATYRSPLGISFLPFGNAGINTDNRMVQWMESHPGWFGQRLREVSLPAETTLICDAGTLSSPLAEFLLKDIDAALLVVNADIRSCAALPDALKALGVAKIPLLGVVLNALDPARKLDRDVHTWLQQFLGEHLLPIAVRRDETLREAFACNRSVFEHAPASRGAYDFSALSIWLTTRQALQQKTV